MQTPNDRESSDQQSRSLADGHLSEYFGIIIKQRKFIGYTVGATFVLSIIVSLLLPKMYLSTARIMPPRENNTGLAGLLSRADDPLSGLAGNLISNPTSGSLFVGIMKSRSMADALNRKFKLKELYKLKYIEDVYSKLADRSNIYVSKKDQLIVVSVMDRDPQRAADMANAYVDMLDQFNRKLNVTQGKRKRLFLEDRLKEVRTDLEKTELDLKAFQEKHHLVSIEEQAKVAIEGAAEIKGQIIAAQTELEIFKQFGTVRQIEAVTLTAKIEELQKQLNSIEQGKKVQNKNSNPPATAKGSNFYIPFDDIPRLGMQLMQLMRETKIQGKLFELLTAQYEMARIEEAKDVESIQVLDQAVAPEKRESPKRVRFVLVSTFLAFIGVLLTVFWRRYQHRFTL